jgi:hypothetical protein
LLFCWMMSLLALLRDAMFRLANGSIPVPSRLSMDCEFIRVSML